MLMIVLRQQYQLHDPCMHHQEYQQIRSPMAGVVKLLLLNRSRDRSAKGVTFKYLKGRDLIDTHYPDALLRQPVRIPIAPKELLRSLFESSIQPRCLPIARAMGLQIDILQDSPHRARADASDNPIRPGLAGQVVARPMRDVQSFGDRLQTGEFNDLRPLHRGNLHLPSRVALPLISEQTSKTQALVALTGSPDGGFVAIELGSKEFTAPACRNSQNNARTANLKPRRCVAMGQSLQLGDVRRVDLQR